MLDTKPLANLLEVADLREGAHTASDGIEHGDHDQAGELVEVEGVVTGLVAVTALAMQMGEEVAEPAKGLQPGQILEQFGDVMRVAHTRRDWPMK